MKLSKILLLSLLVAMACSNEKETAKGYKYTLVRKGDGKRVAPGNFLLMDLMYKNEKDSVLYDNRKNEVPEIIMVRDTTGMSVEEGLDEVFRLLTKGDSVVMIITAQTLYEKTFRQMVPANVDPLSKFTFSMRVNDVIDSVAFVKLQEELETKQRAKALKEREEQMARDKEFGIKQLGIDTVIIDDYLKANKIVAQKTASGLRYISKRQGKGNKAMAGQKVKIHYAGYLLSGKYFDTSWESVARKQNIYKEGSPYQPLELVVGTGSVIPGWEEIMLMMNKGSRMTIYVPSPLGFGNSQRSELLLPNSIMVFDMEMIDIISE